MLKAIENFFIFDKKVELFITEISISPSFKLTL